MGVRFGEPSGNLNSFGNVLPSDAAFMQPAERVKTALSSSYLNETAHFRPRSRTADRGVKIQLVYVFELATETRDISQLLIELL